MPDFKAAIFDLDGTLLDSMGVWEQIDIDFLKKRGFEATPDYIQAITPLGFGMRRPIRLSASSWRKHGGARGRVEPYVPPGLCA